MSFTAVYDANVLYPAPLRDLLMRIALTGIVRARWTDQILSVSALASAEFEEAIIRRCISPR